MPAADPQPRTRPAAADPQPRTRPAAIDPQPRTRPAPATPARPPPPAAGRVTRVRGHRRPTSSMRDTPVTMRIRTALAPVAAALGLSACGSAGSPAASRAAPPEPIIVSAYVGAAQIRVSPARFGAGPVLLTVANQSRRAVALRIVRAGRGLARTAPINPQGVTQLKVDLARGAYELVAAAAGRLTDAQRTLPSRIAPARVRVGRTRPSSGSSLLQP